MVLKADQVIARRPQVLLTKLNNSVGSPTCARILEADRFQRSETKRVAAARRQLFDRETGLEERDLLVEVRFVRLRREDRVDEALILIAVHGAVDVIIAAVE